MAQQVIYKNIALGEEATWGTSVAVSRYMQIVSSGLNANPNKTIVEDTRTSPRGRDRIVRLKNEIGGDIVANASPKVLHNMFELVTGSHGATSAVGTSAINIAYNVNTTGDYLSYTMVHDRNNTQEAFYGVRANSLRLEFSDNLLQATLGTMARYRGIGPSVVDVVGETVKPYIFADMTVSIGRPGYATPVTVPVASFNAEYNNGMERTHLSGSRDASRMDAMVPTLTGSFEVFHEGNSWVSAVYGCSEFYMRIEASTDTCGGQIAGVTPYYLRLDLPRVELSTTTRTYEQAGFAMETIEFIGLYDQGTSSLFKPSLTVGHDIQS